MTIPFIHREFCSSTTVYFQRIYGFFLIFITELICMRTGPLFRGDSLDPDVCHNFICDIALGCGDKDRIITSARDEQQPLRDSSKTMALIPCKFIL